MRQSCESIATELNTHPKIVLLEEKGLSLHGLRGQGRTLVPKILRLRDANTVLQSLPIDLHCFTGQHKSRGYTIPVALNPISRWGGNETKNQQSQQRVQLAIYSHPGKKNTCTNLRYLFARKSSPIKIVSCMKV